MILTQLRERGGSVHPAAYAYRTGYSVVDCAQVHLNAHTVVRLDIADFFGSIRERHVYEVFEELCDGPTRSYELTRLTTVSPPTSTAWRNRGTGPSVKSGVIERSPRYMHNREGFLPQGAPTSGILSNLVMRAVDAHLHSHAERQGWRYTRYSDDLYFSSRKLADHRQIDRLIREVKRRLGLLGLHLNDKKTWVARPGARRSVLGILVDGPVLRLPQSYKRRITMHVRGVSSFGIAHHADHAGFITVDELDSHVTGLLSFAHQVEPEWAAEQLHKWKRLRRLALTPSVSTDAADLVIAGATEAKASIDALVAGAHRYRSARSYADLLSFVGAFKRYSPFNAMLISLQFPGARYVLTEARWRSDFRRVLEPGAQPLVILQPGGPFMVVYDVGDTEALPGALALPPEVTDPISVRATITAADLQQRWDWTVNNLAPLGIRLTSVDHANSSCGSTYRARTQGTVNRLAATGRTQPEEFPLLFEIEVNKNLKPIDRYATVVHELAHLFCGHLGTSPITKWPDRRGGAKSRNEVEAESITHMVLSRLDPDVAMGDYILGYVRRADDMPDVALNLMFKAAGEIIELGSGRIPTTKLRTERRA